MCCWRWRTCLFCCTRVIWLGEKKCVWDVPVAWENVPCAMFKFKHLNQYHTINDTHYYHPLWAHKFPWPQWWSWVWVTNMLWPLFSPVNLAKFFLSFPPFFSDCDSIACFSLFICTSGTFCLCSHPQHTSSGIGTGSGTSLWHELHIPLPSVRPWRCAVSQTISHKR